MSRQRKGRIALVGLAAVLVVVLGVLWQAQRRGAAPEHLATDVRPLIIHSALLARDMPALIYEPAGFDAARAYPVLYVFHGYGSNETSLFEGSFGSGAGIDQVAERLIRQGAICPVVIVSAAINDSYGVDSPVPADGDQFDHGPYERYIAVELIPTVEGGLAPVEQRQRFVAGVSMGGFAALHLAFRQPEAFDGAGALSPAIFVHPPADRLWQFGSSRDENDPLRLAGSAAIETLRLFAGYGDDDYGWVKEATDPLAKRLGERGLRLTPVVVDGGHDEATWRALAPAMLEALLPAPCAATTVGTAAPHS
ncbi:MAG TPA: alpha/beta hydrolase-fold protein [Candidatus Limnocylindrales bacterium]|nr:alpha/beta hydrolase-fold protein [Candidatus Limnocylindrales bacterium]